MTRQLLAIAFVLAALAPGAFVSAQQSSTSSTKPATTAARHSAPPSARKAHHGNVPPWANSVYVNGGSAAQYLATPKPKPLPKNKVKTGSGQEVFKSISN